MNGNDFYVVENPDTLIEKGAGITKKYVVVFSFAEGKYCHKYQTPDPASRGGIFGFLCFDDLSAVPNCLEGKKRNTLGYVQDRPGHTLWQVEVCDMGVDPHVNPFEKKVELPIKDDETNEKKGELPIIVDENNKIMSYFDPRTNRFVQPGNLVFGIHPLTEFIFNHFLAKKNGNHGKENHQVVPNIVRKNIRPR